MTIHSHHLARLSIISCGMLLISGCAVVRPGEVGIKQRLGKLGTKIHEPGAVLHNPLVTRVVKVPTRTMNLEVDLNLPSKEGLNVNSVISILYRIEKNQAPFVINNVGSNYENMLILSVFRSAASDVCAVLRERYALRQSRRD